MKFFFDDHELIAIGSISLNCALQSSLVKVFGPFILNGSLLSENVGVERFLIDPRPFNHMKIEDNIYADTTSNIIKKVFFRFSFDSLNEAFFNKLSKFLYLLINSEAVFIPIPGTPGILSEESPAKD